MAKLYFYMGLPASGKSTYAKEQVLKSGGQIKRLNKDDLRAMIDAGKWSKEREKLVLESRDYLTRIFLLNEKDVIWDDTNLAEKHLKNATNLAAECGAELEIVDHFLEVSVRECVKRDACRNNPVGEEVITNMYFRYLDRKEKYLSSMAPNLPDAVIVDIDGTVAIHNGRSPYDLTKVSEDLPNKPLFRTLKSIQNGGVQIIFVSGREGTVQCLKDTNTWLRKNIINFNLHMRAAGDNRTDFVIKREIFENDIQDRYNILTVIDDRDQTVDMWRSLGLQCWQVGYGSF